ncbi:hypothetical protein Plo01_46260 [Planobispora longispora]|uniref:DUF4158 domain-containing protein n=1 Tax=Planobispora longispora TaxID=28887 RepID=A0A8J3W6V8_9ACTN|nr:hypothetical protein GCM10020093_020730 [Planobispora longispora]GIH78197.1 hypothetical protein Plo01_46260 [Planobispora longispora]
MTSIERTAYPQFKRLTSARVLHVFFTPTADEIDWAQQRATEPQALLAVVAALKCFQKMARFPSWQEIPQVVVDHVRRCLGLADEVQPDLGPGRTAKRHRSQIRARQGVIYDQSRARVIAAEAMGKAALAKNNPPDLINVALERLIEASLELPGFTTLDETATRIRARVNAEIFSRICERMGTDGRERLRALLSTTGPDGRTLFNRLKKLAQRASWSRFRKQAAYLEEIDALGDTGAWLEGIAPSKIADFAGEADAQDADTLSRYDPVKTLALLACLAHTARMRARDDLVEMLCKRVAGNLRKARAALEDIRERQRTVGEKLIGTYRTVLEHLDPDGGEVALGVERAVAAVQQAGGFSAQLADIESVAAFHGDNYEVLAHRFFAKDRSVMFDLVAKLELKATSADDSVLVALGHVRAHEGLRRDFIPLPPPIDGAGDPESGIMFGSGNWRRAITDRRRPGMVARRQFEAMVFAYLAEELRTGDIAVVGAGEYADWSANLLPWSECEPLRESFCAQVGRPGSSPTCASRIWPRPRAWIPAMRATPIWSSPRTAPRLSSAAAANSPWRPPGSWRRRSSGACLSGPCWRSWRAPRTGWAGTAISGPPRARIRRSKRRCSGMCWPSSPAASTWGRMRRPSTSRASRPGSFRWCATGTSTSPS